MITSLLDTILTKLKDKQPDVIKKGADLVLVKSKLLDQLKSEKVNKLFKKVLSFGLKKIK